MSSMNVRMRKENNVPLLFGHVTVHEEPKIIRKRRFVGFREGLRTLAAKALDVVHDSFWVPEQEVLEAGKQSVTYYGVEIKDDPGTESPELVVTKYDGKAHPGAALYFEIVDKQPFDPETMRPPEQPESKARAVGIRPQRPAPNGNGSAAQILSRVANSVVDENPHA